MSDVTLGLDWSMFTPENLELAWLALVYQTRHSHGDRRAPGEKPYETVHQLGLPASEATLMNWGHAKPGIALALETTHHAKKWATAQLLRKGTTEMLERIPPERWRKDEAQAVSELTLRWKQAAKSFVAKGWAISELSVGYEDGTGKVWKNAIGNDGLPYAWHATPAGLEEAEKRIAGTEWAKGAYSALAGASQEDRDLAAKEAPWAYNEFKEEDGAGTA